jgi:hypothetical protein
MAATGMAQSKHALVGTWKLVSARAMNDKGEVLGTAGPNSVGLLTYTADGWMSAVVDVAVPSVPKPPSTLPAREEQSSQASRRFGAYAGSYTVNGDKVTHHIEVAWIQDVVSTDQVRSVRFEGSHLILRGGFLVNGVMTGNGELIWERLKPRTTDN